MELLIVFLILPVIAGLFARYYLKETYTWQEFGVSVVITAIITSVVYVGGLYYDMMDTEILNGEITSKERQEGSYVRTYSCNCRTTGKTTTCSTCFEIRYTVTWIANSTVGSITFDHKDSSSRSVYNSPDPQAYVDCYVGEPASLPNMYMNYVKAVPTSLFNSANVDQAYGVPAYPSIHSFYKVNRVINHDSTVSPKLLTDLDSSLDNHLKVLGPKKQANILVIFTNVKDPMYRFAVENKWVGAKKNDIVLFFGTEGDNVIWSDVMTWALNSGNETLVAELKSKLREIKTVDVDAISNVTASMVDTLYVRPKMEDYEYLKSEIRPTTMLVVICWILNLLCVIISTWYFHHHDMFNGRTFTRPRFNNRFSTRR